MIHHGDLFDVLPTIASDSIDACCTDPPYGIGFMGREWDTFTPNRVAAVAERLRRKNTEYKVSEAYPTKASKTDRQKGGAPLEYDYSVRGLVGFQQWTETWAREVFRVLKPGAYILVCGAPRSYHRMACGLEDAGFVIRDKFSWLFGSGFPKNYNLGEGKGTALKPAHEPIALAWKPFKGSIRACHETHGTAALNINACRIGAGAGGHRGDEPSAKRRYSEQGGTNFAMQPGPRGGSELGRWPANVILDEEAAALLDKQSGELVSGANPTSQGTDKFRGIYGSFEGQAEVTPARGLDVGGASRFYYVAKPSREERDSGCYDLTAITGGEATQRKDGSAGLNNPRAGAGRTGGARNIHPTVKPIELMRWLVRLVTPPGGTVLDPFTGSGTTGMACVYEQREFIGIEREAEYVEIAKRRIASVAPLFTEVSA